MEEHHASWLNLLVALEPEWLRPYVDVFVLHVLLVILLLGVLAWLSSRRLEMVPRTRLQTVGEWIFEGLAGLCRSLIPHHGERYVGIVGSFFLFVLALNLMGLIPGFLSPTARLNTTLALGLMSITIAQVVGLRVNGLRYLGRFFVKTKGGFPIFVHPFKIIEEAVKPMSLAIRLFGNIFGDDTTVAQFALLGAGALGMLIDPTSTALTLRLGGLVGAVLGIAITAVMVSFALFVAFIQALVFSILTSAYLLFAIEME